MSKLSGGSPSVKSKAVYRVKNWSSYNRALVARGSLTIWLDDSLWKQWYNQGPPQRGAQFVYSDPTIEWMLTMRVLLRLPLRQTQGFIQSLLDLMQLDLATPDYSTLSRRQGSLAVVLPKKQTDRPDRPMHLVVDSTGLKVYGEGEWKVRQHGWTKRRTWRKLHVGVHEATGEVVAQTLTSHRIDDASQVVDLLTQVDEAVGVVGGDGAYDRQKVFDALAEPPSGPPIVPLIALRKDATIQQHGNCKAPALARDEILRAIRQKGRKAWKQASGYHRRSLAETQIYRYKHLIGDKLKARSWGNQQVESRLGCAMSYIQKLWMREKKSVSLSITMNPRGPSDEGERIRSMRQYTASEVETIVKDEVPLSLEALIRVGARRMLQAALEFEVDAYVENLQDERDEQGHRQVVKNGAHKPRDLLTGMGPVPIRQPRVHDRREGKAFRSAILPRYMRRAPSIDALIPALYLKGVSTSSFPEALAAILGEQAPGLSPANVVRLKQIWEQEYQAWRHRDLSDKHYVYVWADGIYFQVRLEPDRPCVLVIIGATKDGRKELLAIEDGHRESKLSWQNVLTDLKRRGLKEAPALAIGDGGLGFWAALEEVFPQTQHQRCWVHKSANVLDNLPKTIQAQAKARLHQMYLSPTRQDALGAYEDFLSLYEPKYPKACACLEKDKDVMFTFYDFPAAHWRHLRSTNPIESTFSTVRHRTRQTKGCGSRNATMMMVYKLADQAQKHWHRLHGHKLIELVVQGVEFQDGDVKAAA